MNGCPNGCLDKFGIDKTEGGIEISYTEHEYPDIPVIGLHFFHNPKRSEWGIGASDENWIHITHCPFCDAKLVEAPDGE